MKIPVSQTAGMNGVPRGSASWEKFLLSHESERKVFNSWASKHLSSLNQQRKRGKVLFAFQPAASYAKDGDCQQASASSPARGPRWGSWKHLNWSAAAALGGRVVPGRERLQPGSPPGRAGPGSGLARWLACGRAPSELPGWSGVGHPGRGCLAVGGVLQQSRGPCLCWDGKASEAGWKSLGAFFPPLLKGKLPLFCGRASAFLRTAGPGQNVKSFLNRNSISGGLKIVSH